MWSEDADRAFKELKAMLCSSPILKLPDFDRSFVLRTDASDSGFGAVLLQENDGKQFPIAYASKKLNPTQAAYAIVERECLAIVWALETFTTYLYGRTFVIQTNHQPMAFLRTRLTNPRLIRWSLKLQPYQFKIEATAGKENMGSDFFSAEPLSRLTE